MRGRSESPTEPMHAKTKIIPDFVKEIGESITYKKQIYM